MSEQLKLERLEELYTRWQISTSESYSIEMFFDWVEEQLEKLEGETDM